MLRTLPREDDWIWNRVFKIVVFTWSIILNTDLGGKYAPLTATRYITHATGIDIFFPHWRLLLIIRHLFFQFREQSYSFDTFLLTSFFFFIFNCCLLFLFIYLFIFCFFFPDLFSSTVFYMRKMASFSKFSIIIIIMSCRRHGYPWPSLATSPYRSSLPAGLQGRTLYPHITAGCMFVLVVLLLLGHIWGSIGVHHLWARPCFSSSVLHVWFV